MRLPLSFFEILRNRIQVSQVVGQQLSLQRKGNEFLGLCPFHTEKTPSFTVNDQKRFYHCFGCGAHGDVVKFVSETQGISYNDSAIRLAEEFSIELPTMSPAEQKKYDEEEEVSQILQQAADIYHQLLLDEIKNSDGSVGQYLQQRGINSEIVAQFKLGYAPGSSILTKRLESKKITSAMMYKSGLLGRNDSGGYYEVMRNRLIFPIFNLYNKAIGFGGRALASKQQPKYLNSPETIVFKKGESFYNENNAFSHGYKAGFITVVEGYMDVVKLHAAGFRNVVASLGTAFTADQLQKLWRSIDEVVLCFDGDSAGRGATLKALQVALPIIKSPQRLSVVFLPDKLDPDDLLLAHGVNAMQNLLQSRVPLSEAIWVIESSRLHVQYPEDRVELEKKLDGHLDYINDHSLKRNLRSYYKNKLWQLGRPQQKQRLDSRKHGLGVSISTLSERDTIIASLFSMFALYAQLRTEENLEFIATLIPHASEVNELKTKLMMQSSEENLEPMNDLIKGAGISELYEVLSLAKSNTSAADSEESSEFDTAIWEMLCAQYQLSLLEEEYRNVIDSGADDVVDKALIYQEEILTLRQQIDKLRKSNLLH